MAFVSLRQVLDHAAANSYGVPAFNVNNLEQILAIMETAQKTDSPVILQFRLARANMQVRRICATSIQSIRSGFTSVMRDGSGRYGPIPMPAQAALSDADELTLAH